MDTNEDTQPHCDSENQQATDSDCSCNNPKNYKKVIFYSVILFAAVAAFHSWSKSNQTCKTSCNSNYISSVYLTDKAEPNNTASTTPKAESD